MASTIFSHMYKAATGDQGSRSFDLTGIEALILAASESKGGVASPENCKIFAALGACLSEPLAYALAKGLVIQSGSDSAVLATRLVALRSIATSAAASALVRTAAADGSAGEEKETAVRAIAGLPAAAQEMANTPTARGELLKLLLATIAPDDALHRTYIDNQVYEVTRYAPGLSHARSSPPVSIRSRLTKCVFSAYRYPYQHGRCEASRRGGAAAASRQPGGSAPASRAFPALGAARRAARPGFACPRPAIRPAQDSPVAEGSLGRPRASAGELLAPPPPPAPPVRVAAALPLHR